MGFVGLLTILFIALKLTKVIAWSWIWVISPIWISVLIYVIGFLITFIILTIKEKRNK